jgi:hypothetical protein
VPFLRVLRDKRGYETTYLMHWFRDGGRQRSRVLYVFRTPGGARVGRAPLEPAVMRQLEQRYPDIPFDWRAVLEQQQIIEAAPEIRRRKVRRDEMETAGAAAEREPSADPALARPGSEASAASVGRPPLPAAIEGATPAEQIAFLERVYPMVRERVAQQVADPVRREVLGALAERLNPSAWTGADQITTGLQQAAEALERLARALVRRRRRGRRRAASAADAAPVMDASDGVGRVESDSD